MSYQLSNILVTGGAGFIGSHFIRYLLAQNPNVIIYNIDSLTYAGSLNNLCDLADPARHIFIQGDITDAELVQHTLEKYEIDTIVHFAAESHVDRSIQGPGRFIQTNVVGTFTLLEAARQYWLLKKKWDSTNCRFHHISTDEVYGALMANEEPFTEQTPYAPRSPYSASKASSDHIVRAYFHTYGLPTTISNCSNNYGPYQHTEKLIPTIIRACREKKTIPIYGDGTHIRDWLYVEDHCRGIEKILQRGRIGETYNIGGDYQVDNMKMAMDICNVMDELYPAHKPHHTLIRLATDRPGHDWRYAVDSRKIQHELDWQPQETFNEGIRKTIAFYSE